MEVTQSLQNSCQVVITSAGLPHWLVGPSQAAQEASSPEAVFQLLGPVINEDTLETLEQLYSRPEVEVAELLIIGFMRMQGYEILSAAKASEASLVHQYLRPLACSFTELGLSSEEISQVSLDDGLMDCVMECYVSHLLDDFLFFARERLPGRIFRVRGSFLSRKQGRLLSCQARERQLTPRFGTLAFTFDRERFAAQRDRV